MWIQLNCEKNQYSHFRNKNTVKAAGDASKKAHGITAKARINFRMKKFYNFKASPDQSMDDIATEFENILRTQLVWTVLEFVKPSRDRAKPGSLLLSGARQFFLSKRKRWKSSKWLVSKWVSSWADYHPTIVQRQMRKGSWMKEFACWVLFCLQNTTLTDFRLTKTLETKHLILPRLSTAARLYI